jgi:hypothetical protein
MIYRKQILKLPPFDGIMNDRQTNTHGMEWTKNPPSLIGTISFLENRQN